MRPRQLCVSCRPVVCVWEQVLQRALRESRNNFEHDLKLGPQLEIQSGSNLTSERVLGVASAAQVVTAALHAPENC